MRAGAFEKAHAMIKVPEAWSGREGAGLMNDYFSKDRLGRHLCKLAFFSGRWVLWGRSGRALEAVWR